MRIDPDILNDAIETFENEFLLVQQSFRWVKNGQIIPNAQESFTLKQVVDFNGWEIVQTFGSSIAICKEKY